jgi:hypothetical protein
MGENRSGNHRRRCNLSLESKTLTLSSLFFSTYETLISILQGVTFQQQQTRRELFEFLFFSPAEIELLESRKFYDLFFWPLGLSF